MSLNDSLFGEENIRWEAYFKLMQESKEQKRATENEKEYNKTTNRLKKTKEKK